MSREGYATWFYEVLCGMSRPKIPTIPRVSLSASALGGCQGPDDPQGGVRGGGEEGLLPAGSRRAAAFDTKRTIARLSDLPDRLAPEGVVSSAYEARRPEVGERAGPSSPPSIFGAAAGAPRTCAEAPLCAYA